MEKTIPVRSLTPIRMASYICIEVIGCASYFVLSAWPISSVKDKKIYLCIYFLPSCGFSPVPEPLCPAECPAACTGSSKPGVDKPFCS